MILLYQARNLKATPMIKNTFPVNGGALPKIDRSALMSRAWAIFRETYKYPQIKFSDIGRKCFAWALRQAWAEAREAARVAALSAADKAERIETLENLISRAAYIDHDPTWKAAIMTTGTSCAICMPLRKEATTNHQNRTGRTNVRTLARPRSSEDQPPFQSERYSNDQRKT